VATTYQRRVANVLLATYLLAHTGSGYSIAAAIAGCAIVTLVAVALMDDHSRSDIDDDASFERSEPEAVAREHAAAGLRG